MSEFEISTGDELDQRLVGIASLSPHTLQPVLCVKAADTQTYDVMTFLVHIVFHGWGIGGMQNPV